jgi:hypothetical protein
LLEYSLASSDVNYCGSVAEFAAKIQPFFTVDAVNPFGNVLETFSPK